MTRSQTILHQRRANNEDLLLDIAMSTMKGERSGQFCASPSAAGESVPRFQEQLDEASQPSTTTARTALTPNTRGNSEDFAATRKANHNTKRFSSAPSPVDRNFVPAPPDSPTPRVTETEKMTKDEEKRLTISPEDMILMDDEILTAAFEAVTEELGRNQQGQQQQMPLSQPNMGRRVIGGDDAASFPSATESVSISPPSGSTKPAQRPPPLLSLDLISDEHYDEGNNEATLGSSPTSQPLRKQIYRARIPSLSQLRNRHMESTPPIEIGGARSSSIAVHVATNHQHHQEKEALLSPLSDRDESEVPPGLPSPPKLSNAIAFRRTTSMPTMTNSQRSSRKVGWRPAFRRQRSYDATKRRMNQNLLLSQAGDYRRSIWNSRHENEDDDFGDLDEEEDEIEVFSSEPEDGDDESVYTMSSEFSLNDEEVMRLARRLATPTKRSKKSTTSSGKPMTTLFRSHAPSPPDSDRLIARNDTLKTTAEEDEEEIENELESDDEDVKRRWSPHNRRSSLMLDRPPSRDSDSSSHGKKGSKMFGQRQYWHYVAYLSALSILGGVCRVYIDRFFGADCEFDVNYDWLTIVSRHVCVTSSGRTAGGALFTDWPANVVGSFLLGLMSMPGTRHGFSWPPLPWFGADHPLQSNDPLLVALKTGFCGSLTTFASWNAQMVMMMDGTHTELGSQVATALLGYVVGIMTAVMSFLFGQHVSFWVNRKRYSVEDDTENRRSTMSLTPFDVHSSRLSWTGAEIPPRVTQSTTEIPPRVTSPTGTILAGNSTTADEETGRTEDELNNNNDVETVVSSFATVTERRQLRWWSSIRCSCFQWTFFSHSALPFVLVVLLLGGFLSGDFLSASELESDRRHFYRSMWMLVICTPAGAWLRWELGKKRILIGRGMGPWIPWGTFTANMLGSLVSIALLGIQVRYMETRFGSEEDDGDAIPWHHSIVFALRVGFAGSLSTVSTFVQEVVDLHQRYPFHAKAYWYALLTIVAAELVSLVIYIPMVHS